MGKCPEGIECKEPVEYERKKGNVQCIDSATCSQSQTVCFQEHMYGHDRIAGIAHENTLTNIPGIVRVNMIWVGTGRQSGSCRPAGRGEG